MRLRAGAVEVAQRVQLRFRCFNSAEASTKGLAHLAEVCKGPAHMLTSDARPGNGTIEVMERRDVFGKQRPLLREAWGLPWALP